MPIARHACTVFTALASFIVGGCSIDSAPESKPATSNSADNEPPRVRPAATTAASPAVRLKPPSAVAGELSRRVLAYKDGHPANESIVRRTPRAGQEYSLHAACTSTRPGKVMSAEIRSGEVDSDGEAMVTTDVTCDGTVIVIDLGKLPAEAIVVYLQGDQSDMTTGYAVVAPTSSLSGAE
jgi:hypothetical protein